MSKRRLAANAPVNPHLPAFVISVPASKPRAFIAGNRSPKVLHQGRPSQLRKRRPERLIGRWSGIDVATEYPFDLGSDSEDESSQWETVPASTLAEVPNSLPSSTPHTPLSASAVPSAVSLDTQSAVVGAKNHQVRGISAPPGDFEESSDSRRDNSLRHFAGPVECMTSLPMSATKQNAMLVHCFAEMLYRFKGSFEGQPDPDNPFISQYVPWCIQSPLLAKTSLYIAASSLAERRYVDQTSKIRFRGAAISTLNNHLQSEAWRSDEALAGVVQFVSIEWYFGEPEVVHAHLTGLREMVRLRGGFTQVGVGALVTKVALVDDNVIAMSLDRSPILPRGPGFYFGYSERPRDQFKLRFNSPFLTTSISFQSCAEALDMHPITASMLDDMRFLINATLELPPDASSQELQRLQATAKWIYDRISQLPLERPDACQVPVSEILEKDEQAALVDSFSQDQTTPCRTANPVPHSFLPEYPALNSSASPSSSSSASSPHSTSTPLTQSSVLNPSMSSNPQSTHISPSQTQRPSPPTPPPTDHVYKAIRLASPLYASAIAARYPFSSTVSEETTLAVLAAIWRIPLARWRGVVAVLLFTVLPITATAANSRSAWLRPHAGFIKSVLQFGFMQLAIEDWKSCAETMGRMADLLAWLRSDGVAVTTNDTGS